MDGRPRAVEREGLEAVDGAEVGVEAVVADVEILAQPGLPGEVVRKPIAHPIAARLGRPASRMRGSGCCRPRPRRRSPRSSADCP